MLKLYRTYNIDYYRIAMKKVTMNREIDVAINGIQKNTILLTNNKLFELIYIKKDNEWSLDNVADISQMKNIL